MLLNQKMKEMHLPHAEAGVVQYLLAQGSAVRGLSTRRIASECYTTPPTLVRLGQRLGFEGLADFIDAFLDEQDYVERHFQQIDANRPFSPGSSPATIANKIATLQQESIQDTIALLDYHMLQKAVNCLLRTRNVYLVGVSISLDCTYQFKHQMQRLGKNVILEANQGELLCTLMAATPDDCAIVVSYSGTTQRIVDAMRILYEEGVPIILLTGLGQNPIIEKAECVLHMTTRERLYSKIGNFTTEVSTHLLLDILYSCYFAADYEKNWDRRIRTAHQAELYRLSDNEIMME